MGRFSTPLAPLFADFAGVHGSMDILDVGCGPGALTGELLRRAGTGRVAAADPSPQFVAACGERFPAVDVRQAPAEELPFPDGAFDAALAQLVITFMSDGVAGVGEMARVTRDGGVVAACMWDLGPGMELLDIVHDAAVAVAPDYPAAQPPPRYRSEAELRTLFEDAGLHDVETAPLEITAEYESVDDFWHAVLGGVGPLGDLLQSLDSGDIDRFRDEVTRRLGGRGNPFSLSGRAWAVSGRPRLAAADGR